MSLVALTVLIHAERVLLVQEAKLRVFGTWNIPGGRVEPGESVVDAARREVQEEAGIDVALRGLMLIDQGVASNDPTRQVTRFVFVGDVGDPHALLLKSQPDEHSLRAQWFELSELPQLPLRNPLVRNAIELASRNPVLLPLTALRADFTAMQPVVPG